MTPPPGLSLVRGQWHGARVRRTRCESAVGLAFAQGYNARGFLQQYLQCGKIFGKICNLGESEKLMSIMSSRIYNFNKS